MDHSHQCVFGLFSTRGAAENSVEILKNNGFRQSEITLLLPQLADSHNVRHTKSNKSAQFAIIGLSLGVIIGATYGLLISTDQLLSPLPSIIEVTAGPVMSTLAGIGLGGLIGALTGAAIGFDFPRFEVYPYEKPYEEGGILISIHVDNENGFERAKTILESTGAKDVTQVSEIKSHAKSITSKPSSSEADINQITI